MLEYPDSLDNHCLPPPTPTHTPYREMVPNHSTLTVKMTVINCFLFFSLYNISINHSPEVKQTFPGVGGKFIPARLSSTPRGQHFPAGLSYAHLAPYPGF